MQFEKCLTCPEIKGKQCAGPNFSAAPAKDVIEWIIAFQKIHGITNARLAEHSGVPKGTIDGLKHRTDVRHDTLYPIIKSLIELVGGVWGGGSCAADSGASAQEILRLKQELETQKDQLARYASEAKERNRVLLALFGLCAGLVLLLLVLSL